MPGDDYFMHAFGVLATHRARSMRVLENGSMTTETGPIPWSSAYDYAGKMGFVRSTCVWFADVMLALDAKWREHKTLEADKERRRGERARKRKMSVGKFRKQFGGKP